MNIGIIREMKKDIDQRVVVGERVLKSLREIGKRVKFS